MPLLAQVVAAVTPCVVLAGVIFVRVHRRTDQHQAEAPIGPVLSPQQMRNVQQSPSDPRLWT